MVKMCSVKVDAWMEHLQTLITTPVVVWEVEELQIDPDLAEIALE